MVLDLDFENYPDPVFNIGRFLDGRLEYHELAGSQRGRVSFVFRLYVDVNKFIWVKCKFHSTRVHRVLS